MVVRSAHWVLGYRVGTGLEATSGVIDWVKGILKYWSGG